MPLGRSRDDLRYNRLTQLTGIGPRLADKIRYKLAEGIELSESERHALRIVQEDPYRLSEVDGIGFKKADAVALNDYDVDPDAPVRHKHGNREALKNDGCLPYRDFRSMRRKLGLLNAELEFEGVEQDSGLIWLPEELRAEWLVARWVAQRLQHADHTTVPTAVLSDAQQQIMDEAGLNDDQRRAVLQALFRGRLLVLTGGAGTGKTHTLGALARCARKERKTMHVMAFAGKAADRAAEVLGGVARCSTIHRGLGLGKVRPEDEIGLDMLEDDIIVLDEASMIPTWLLAHVIAALPPHATLILTGDPAQLPPIGHGFPFADIIEMGAPRVHLEQNYRQAGQVSIFELAEGIRTRAKWPTVRDDLPGLELHTDLSDDDLDHYSQGAIEYAKGFDLNDWQCLTWRNETREMLNLELQAIFNPRGERLLEYGCWALGKHNGAYTFAEIRIGDKVMVKKNNYEVEVYNGQTGVVTGRPSVAQLEAEAESVRAERQRIMPQADLGLVDALTALKQLDKRLASIDAMLQKPGVVIKIKDREIAMSADMAEELLCLGYAITVHKAQGSGWPLVIIFQPDEVGDFSLPNRFYYTAVTRAEKELFLFTQLGMGQWWRNATRRETLPESTLQKRIEASMKVAEVA
jgi:exodeoxyribonuclease V alpha subunit